MTSSNALPTRVTPKTFTLLEHVLTNDTSSEIIPGILRWDISDHFPTLVQIKILRKRNLFKPLFADLKQILTHKNSCHTFNMIYK